MNTTEVDESLKSVVQCALKETNMHVLAHTDSNARSQSDTHTHVCNTHTHTHTGTQPTQINRWVRRETVLDWPQTRVTLPFG